MGLIDCTSRRSLERGYDYYLAQRVKNLLKTDETQYTADVEGRMPEPYKVLIDIAHPRSSKCNCPHADGKRIICKHMIAVYFTVFPDEAKRIFDEIISHWEDDDEYYEFDDYDEYDEYDEYIDDEIKERVCQYVKKLKKDELQRELIDILLEGPQWQIKKFMQENDIYYEY